MKRAKNVEEYISDSPEKYRAKLEELRAVIKKVAPKAEESISYGMPFYGYKGRLVYFALMKNHIGLYIPPPIIDNHKKDLKNYGITKSAIHLPIDGELPVDLIKKLVNARVKWNEGVKK